MPAVYQVVRGMYMSHLINCHNNLTSSNLSLFVIEENKAQGGEASCPGSQEPRFIGF